MNHGVIAFWQAQNIGDGMHDGIYMCEVEYRNMQGTLETNTFFLKHNYGDGALALTAKVMLEYDNQRGEAYLTCITKWFDFCTKHNLNPYTAAGNHFPLKKEL